MLMNGISEGSRITEKADTNIQEPNSTNTVDNNNEKTSGTLLDTFSSEQMKYVNFLAKQIGLNLQNSRNNNIEDIKDKIEELTIINIDNSFSASFRNINFNEKSIAAIAQVLGYENIKSVDTKQGFIDFIIWLFKGYYSHIVEIVNQEVAYKSTKINKNELSEEELKEILLNQINELVGNFENIFSLSIRDIEKIDIKGKRLNGSFKKLGYLNKSQKSPRIYDYLQAICKLYTKDINELYDNFKTTLKQKINNEENTDITIGKKTITSNKAKSFLVFTIPKDYYADLNMKSIRNSSNKSLLKKELLEKEKKEAMDSIASQIKEKVGDMKYIFLLELKEIMTFKVLSYSNNNNIISFFKDIGYFEVNRHDYKYDDYLQAICKLFNKDRNKLYKEFQDKIAEEINQIDFKNTKFNDLLYHKINIGNKKITLYRAYKYLDPSSKTNSKSFNRNKETMINNLKTAIEKLSQS